ncbi:Chitin synthase, class 3 [Lobosporangium transversale]|uniref:chitin synthase n=1 Tax=Lobosporangium transversale TaxID=64571 RepID=A0A1Y2G9L7_9FUNG|nr:chitin synthase-domain-containing protein [Lobosporangium transversale]KAF9913696.1 Chitin synthase, class 3 [Lobosporangium transversale]ORZ04820.1 chitin synthase-domain-containing protein [Lobosporangium transversale]|eukprot:XP_021876757.1 chitin synthase-domain-containing protein [Lobosporangium transversale]
MDPTHPDIEAHGVAYDEPQGRRTGAHVTGNSLSPDNNTTNARRPTNFKRQKSLVRPERERVDRNHPQYYYRNATQNLDGSNIRVQASTTGTDPTGATLSRTGVRRGKSVLGREPEKAGQPRLKAKPAPKNKFVDIKALNKEKEWPSKWVIYYNAITCCFPAALLKSCGMHTAEIQRAWREKIALVSLIIMMVLAVAFLTFGLQQALCRDNQSGKYVAGSRPENVIIHGKGYYFNAEKSRYGGIVWMHPAINKDISNEPVDIMNAPDYGAKGMDASFLFQDPAGGACEGFIRRSAPPAGDDPQANYYFPCVMRNVDGSTSVNNAADKNAVAACHISNRNVWYGLAKQSDAPTYYTWGNITNSQRNFFAYDGDVIDADILKWIKPEFTLDERISALFNGTIGLQRDLSFMFAQRNMINLGKCLKQIARVGAMDSKTIGCMTSDVITYVSLVIILGVVFIKFFLAVFFGWFLSHKLGGFDNETYQDRMKRAEQIEAWSSDINRPAFSTKRQTFFPTTSRFTPTTPTGSSSALNGSSLGQPSSRPLSTFNRPTSVFKPYTPPGSPGANPAHLSASNTSLSRASYFNQPMGPNGTPPPSPPPLPGAIRPSSVASFGGLRQMSRRSSTSSSTATQPSNCPLPLSPFSIAQPPVSYQPFNFPLIHTMALVTCYSEGIDGLRTTLDSIATTDYPNSHKLIVVICDGMIIGAGNNMSTPDICLSMMQDDLIPRDEVMAHSYVAIADGTKRHNMAKVYAGFYKYDDETVPDKKLQKRVPMCLIVKVGGPTEQNMPKPGNRGKRDSQIILMGFLQHVMFDERMTSFEYELFNTIWRITGVAPDRYEIVLMVDADTKVYPDSLSRMIAAMAHDYEIMGLCGETKIANKTDSWVTMIQVFEYYISHHMSKAFESMFGGVTCLPGCFCMYRIKAPKGPNGYWVPILANPDIVEHYSENVVDTLHKKNLLLLGEDRYLSTLMLRTFPKRKMMFVPQAICKTVVPDTFKILLSQRRRWINSTIHNLLELVLVRDLCGTFCFSMQFVIFMELVGTVVLPAAISFTIYLCTISVYRAISHDESIPDTTVPLLLLAAILGLPAVLIVMTSRKMVYVGWMMVYLCSIFVWNFVLPAYAYWHFDDFSWGQTRMVAGETAGADHGGKEGQFDSSHITMKRWGEWERERRQKAAVLAGLPAPHFTQASDSGDDWNSTANGMSGSGGAVREEELSDASSNSRRTGDSGKPFGHMSQGSTGSMNASGGYTLTDPGFPGAPGMDSIPLLNMHAPAPGGTIGRQRVSQFNPYVSGVPGTENRMSGFITPQSRQFTSSPKMSSNLATSSYTPPPPPPGVRLGSIDTKAPTPMLMMAAGASRTALSGPNQAQVQDPAPASGTSGSDPMRQSSDRPSDLQ